MNPSLTKVEKTQIAKAFARAANIQESRVIYCLIRPVEFGGPSQFSRPDDNGLVKVKPRVPIARMPREFNAQRQDNGEWAISVNDPDIAAALNLPLLAVARETSAEPPASWPEHWKARAKAVRECQDVNALSDLLAIETSEAVKKAIHEQLAR